MLIDLILLIPVTSLICAGVYYATMFKGWEFFDEHPEAMKDQKVEDKMILWWVRYYGSRLPEFWRNPLYICPPCMASVYSIPVLASYFYYHQNWWGLLVYPLFVAAVAGLNGILKRNLL